jgi:hypothetical protein
MELFLQGMLRCFRKPQEVLLPTIGERIDAANAQAAERLMDSQPVLVDVAPAAEAIPGMTSQTILHAGPPISWDRMCGPVRGAVIGALNYEGLAASPEEAEKLAASGSIRFDPCHHHQTVGPMAGVVSPSMPVWVVLNKTFGNYAFCTLNEGLGKVLRFGAYGREVIERLKWIERVLGPGLARALEGAGGINLKNIIAQALQMGDECHNRNMAASNIILRELLPHLLGSDVERSVVREITDFIAGNVHFFLNLSMAACKVTADTIVGLKDCSLICLMARNGTDFGLKVAGLGDRWFTAPAGIPRGLYFPGYTESDANPDLGDSTIAETVGLGGCAMASAPAIVKFVGGTPMDALDTTRQMYEICVTQHRDLQMPAMDFMGVPLGIDIRRVVETGIAPVINTGIAHREAGIGQVGAGILRAPMESFEEALVAFGDQYE